MKEPTELVDRSFSTTEYERMPLQVWLLSAVTVVIGLVTFYMMATHRESREYLYLFFYSIPANTAISVFPHEPVLIYYGTFANLWISAAVATVGTMVAGYLDHRVFVPILNYKKITAYKKSRFYRKAAHYLMRYPFATLLVTGYTPIPFFPFKFLAFSIHYPLHRYLAALALARFPRYATLAWVGLAFGIPKTVLIASVVVIFGLYAIRGGPTVWRRLQARRQAALRSEVDTG